MKATNAASSAKPASTAKKSRPPLHLVITMLLLVYASWGSIYIGNKLSLEIAGPFLVCGLRNVLAGLLTLGVCCLRKGMWKTPSLKDVWNHSIIGVMLVLMSGGFLVLGQTQVSSGVAAVIMGSTPIFMLVAAWLFAGEPAPTRIQCLGMCTGASAIIYLSWSEQSAGTGTIAGVLILLGAIAGWVAGSLITKSRNIAGNLSLMESTGLLLLMGGLESLVLGLLVGEAGSIQPQNLRFDTILAFSWMVVGGSFLAYVCYLWLLNNVSVSLAVSYEYVVPVIGICLGCFIGGETVSGDMIIACMVSISSVFLVVRHRHSFKSYIRHYLVHKTSSSK